VRTADFDYDLDPGRIAQTARPRGTSRLLVLDRRAAATEMRGIAVLPALLQPGDLLVLNDVRVIPARLVATRPGGGEAELLLVRPLGDGTWEAMARPAKRLRAGVPLALHHGVAIPVERLDEGRWRLTFDPPLDAAHLAAVGQVPLPPYIHRDGAPSRADEERYQTIYAATGRAVAAPTAGLHFTPELLDSLAERGVETARLTLHVGPGTFRPVQVDDVREHKLDTEDYEVPAAAAIAIARARAAGRRIVAVGTTTCRTLEYAAAVGAGRVLAGSGRADVFIYPGYHFRVVDALLTNFHLPKSTLIMLVAALAGREPVLDAYRQAAATGFFLYSFADAMLVL